MMKRCEVCVLFTFMMGATMGMTTVTGTPHWVPWYASACAWFPKRERYNVQCTMYNVQWSKVKDYDYLFVCKWNCRKGRRGTGLKTRYLCPWFFLRF